MPARTKKPVQMQRKNNAKRPGGITGKGFKPGQSGNPGGRPKGSIKFSTALERSLARLVPNDPLGRTYAQLIADKTVEMAAEGNMAAIKEIADRTEGRARQTHSSPQESATDHASFKQRLLKIVDKASRQYNKPRSTVIRDIAEIDPTLAPFFLDESGHGYLSDPRLRGQMNELSD